MYSCASFAAARASPTPSACADDGSNVPDTANTQTSARHRRRSPEGRQDMTNDDATKYYEPLRPAV